MAIKLGTEVKDAITGFAGTITARTEYLTGGTRICVESKTLHEGRPVEAWFDEQRFEAPLPLVKVEG